MPNATTNVTDDLVQNGRPDRVDGRHVNLPLELGSTIVFDTLAEFETARDARYDSGTTCAVMFEAPGSGTFEVPDIPAVARDANVPAILDGTWVTPIFASPLHLVLMSSWHQCRSN